MTLQTSALCSSLTFKVLFIAFLVLVLLIPMNMVENIIRERGHLYHHANDEIVSI
jgi:inner membrane protein involved in colicin E2 resistance